MEIKDNKGITLLIAVLIAGLLLSVSLSIFNIAMKELIISSSGRDSHISFYAADAGAECALYWDWNQGSFGHDVQTQISCAGHTFNVSGDDTEFTFNPGAGVLDICAQVKVTKTETDTLIESRGYNTCIPTVRRTERGLRIKYPNILQEE
jgi:hypothetical protein